MSSIPSQSTVPDFTDAELYGVREMLVQHYLKDVEITLSRSDVSVSVCPDNTISCPAIFWHEGGANFVLVKTGALRYQTRFFYTPLEQFSTETAEHNDIKSCVTAVLQLHSDHQRKHSGVATDAARD